MLHRRLLSRVSTVIPGCVATLALLATAPAQNHLFTVEGIAGPDRLGQSVAGVGDVNKDGFADFASGAYLGTKTTTVRRPGYVRVYSGKNGAMLYEFVGDKANDQLGWTTGGAGDVNKDTYPDIVVGANVGDPSTGTNAGYVRVYSGKDGKIIWTFNGDKANDQMGSGAAGAGDVDRDGWADIIVGARLADPTTGSNAGIARVYSGKDGKALATINGLKANDQFGSSVRGAGDVNLDGYPDVVVGAPNALAGKGQVTVISGKWIALGGTNKQVLYTFDGLASPANATGIFGYCVSGAGDVNRDGFADIIAGADRITVGTVAEAGSVRVFSGLTGKVIYTINGTTSFERLGRSVRGAGDVDKDGYADFIIGAYQYKKGTAPTYRGLARVYSGKTGNVIATISGDANNDRLGIDVDAAGDVNGDGFPDVIAGAYLGRGSQNGFARVWSVKAMTLTTDSHLLSLAAAKNTQNFALNAGVAHKGRLYWIFGSVTGTSPGTTILGVNIPLNYDAWTDFTILLANTAPFFNSRGTLDALGKATAKIEIAGPLNLPALVGTTLYHAFLVYDGNGAFHTASNPTTLLITK